MKHPGDHDDDRWHQVEQLKEKLEASLGVGLRIEAEDHNIVVGSHLSVEVRFVLLKGLVTILVAKQVYHSSLQVEFSNVPNIIHGLYSKSQSPPVPERHFYDWDQMMRVIIWVIIWSR